jgi:hypothetical protein
MPRSAPVANCREDQPAASGTMGPPGNTAVGALTTLLLHVTLRMECLLKGAKSGIQTKSHENRLLLIPRFY